MATPGPGGYVHANSSSFRACQQVLAAPFEAQGKRALEEQSLKAKGAAPGKSKSRSLVASRHASPMRGELKALLGMTAFVFGAREQEAGETGAIFFSCGAFAPGRAARQVRNDNERVHRRPAQSGKAPGPPTSFVACAFAPGGGRPGLQRLARIAESQDTR
jgi:hypothetical protein